MQMGGGGGIINCPRDPAPHPSHATSTPRRRGREGAQAMRATDCKGRKEEQKPLWVTRDEWLRRLESSRGRSADQQCVAQWDSAFQMARVVQERGNELRVLGISLNGALWLRAEEALCLLEDGLLILHVNGASISVQEAYELLLTPMGKTLSHAVFSFLHRANFVSRPRPMIGAASRVDMLPQLLNVRAANVSFFHSQQLK